MIQIILTYLIICISITYTIIGLYNAVRKKKCNCNNNCGDLKKDIMKMKKL